MRYYLYQNEYKSYDYLHNHKGFTTSPSETIEYLYTDSNRWGHYFTYVYYLGVPYDLSRGEYYVSTVYVGWRSLDNLAIQLGLMPNAYNNIDTTLEFTDGNQTSPAAKIITFKDLGYEEPVEIPIYLIQAAINNGWHTEEEWEQLGWTENVEEFSLFGGNIITNDNIFLSVVDGGGGNINKHPLRSRRLQENIGWCTGGSFVAEPVYIPKGGVITEISDDIEYIEDIKPLDKGGIYTTRIFEDSDIVKYIDSSSIITMGSIGENKIMEDWIIPEFGIIIED